MPELMHAQPIRRYMETTQGLQGIEMGNQRIQGNKIANQTGEFNLEQQQKRNKAIEVAKAASWADTPEKWDQMKQYFLKNGASPDFQKLDFNNREMVIALGSPASWEKLKNAPSIPAAVLETEWLKNQDKETQDLHFRAKRAQKTLNLGGEQVVLDPEGNIDKSYTVTPKESETPQFKASVAEAVEQAKAQAKSRGEAFSDYNRAQASLPGLKEVVNKLKTLSDVATYTTTGKVFDTVVKELGFGATEGATARAKMQSLVDNQILPLLRDTFGAQFTEAEGERLRQTMLDIDAAPEQKKAILDSFLEQKMRDLQTKENELGVGGDADPAQEIQQLERELFGG